MEQKPLNVKEKISDIEKRYKELMGEQTSFSMLLMGIYGAGKTRCSCTGRLPILVDVFDPRGTVIFHTDPFLKQLLGQRKIVLRPFWKEDSKHPSEFDRWQKVWEEDCKNGFLSMFGTYVLDSGTTWIESMTNYIRVKKARGDNLQVQDYIPMYNLIMDVMRISSSQGCDFIYTAHLLPIQDEVTGEVKAEIDTYKRLRSKIPKMFSEKYVVKKEKTSQGINHKLLLHSTGMYEASSQLMAAGNIPNKIDPDIKNLLRMAGLRTDDKSIQW